MATERTGTGRHDANRQTAMTNCVAALAQTEAAMEILRAQDRCCWSGGWSLSAPGRA